MSSMSSPSLNDILAERHASADSETDIVDVDEPAILLVIVRLGDQTFAFPGARIGEILAAPRVYRVPGAPAALEGVISVRGAIESVLCLRTLLQLPAAAEPISAEQTGAVLLTRGHGLHSGLRVDEVIDLLELPESALREAPDTLPESLRPFVRHLIQIGEYGAGLLDLDRLLAAYTEHAG